MRYRSLDAVRGLAAVGVVIHHHLLSLPETVQARLHDALKYTPLKILMMGRPFVIVFFVLSGFVLTIAIDADRTFTWRGFAVKRLCRIYLPYAASIVFSILLFELFYHPEAGLSAWAASTWQNGADGHVIAMHFLMSGTALGAALNNVNWSLVYELRISLIFPLLLVVVTRFGTARAFIIAAILSTLADIGLHYSDVGLHPTLAETPVDAVLVTLHFMVQFMLGAVLARHIGACTLFLRKTGWRGQSVLLFVAAMLLMVSVDDANVVGAALLIMLAAVSPLLVRGLEYGLPQFLGRISYSLYLIHVPILIGLIYLCHNRISAALYLPASIAVSLALAAVAHRVIELPAIGLGKNLAGRV